ncbi:MAG: phosphotransferase family protein [Acidobacteriota bacterium]|nr:phosphotransferase family protein [Acidobacteriota bacterium]
MQEQLQAVLSRIVPDYRGLTRLERLPQGASAETYEVRVDAGAGPMKICLRRAAGGSEVAGPKPGLRVQARLMQLAAEGGVPAPEILHVLEPSDGLGDGFLMGWVEGESLGSRIVRSERWAEIRPRLARECGEVLARIHAIDLDDEGLAGSLARTQAREEVEQTWERYKLLESPQPMIDYTGRWLLDHLPPPTENRLVHAEFRNGNFIIDESGIRAVLDWEMAHVGDPMRDLGWLCNNSWTYGNTALPVGGFGTVDQLVEGYEATTDAPVDRDRLHFWTVFGSFWWSVTCLTMVTLFREGPDRSIERAAIGRRSSEAQIDCVNLLIPGPVDRPDAATEESTLDLPRSDELLTATVELLRGDVMESTSGRLNFLARVAANSLDIVIREGRLGPRARRQEHGRLEALFGEGDLQELRWHLARGLRSGDVVLELPGLAEHLRQAVVDQISIDQPRYSGLKSALVRDTPHV